jgi:hypothetical protein
MKQDAGKTGGSPPKENHWQLHDCILVIARPGFVFTFNELDQLPCKLVEDGLGG